MPPTIQQQVARQIGLYYLNKEGTHEKAVETILTLRFTKVIVDEIDRDSKKSLEVALHSGRVGLIIGKRGININNLESWLTATMGLPVKVKLFEDDLIDSLLPLTPVEEREQIEEEEAYRGMQMYFENNYDGYNGL